MTGIIIQESPWVGFIALQPLGELRRLIPFEPARVKLDRRRLFVRVTLISERTGAFMQIIAAPTHPSISFFEGNPEVLVRQLDLRAPVRIHLQAKSGEPHLADRRSSACVISFGQNIRSIFDRNYPQ